MANKDSFTIYGGEEHVDTAAVSERAFALLAKSDWQGAQAGFDEVLREEPGNANAHLGKLLAELNLTAPEQLASTDAEYEANPHYRHALWYGDEAFCARLKSYAQQAHVHKKSQTQQLYEQALQKKNEAYNSQTFEQAAQQFLALGDYRDAPQLVRECAAQADHHRKDECYHEALNVAAGGTAHDYEKAVKMLAMIPGWRDADALASSYRQKIEQASDALLQKHRIENERLANERKSAEKKEKKRITIILCATLIPLVSLLVFVTLLITVLIPKNKYAQAIEAMEQGQYVRAYEGFNTLGDYKDSRQKAKDIFNQYKIEKLKESNVGDIVYFGTYEQDNDSFSGTEDMEWLVVAREGGNALLVSKCGVDCVPYHEAFEDVSWQTCSLRAWLNDTFYTEAFSPEEQSQIVETTVSADGNPEYATDPGEATRDQVFLLSIPQVLTYFSDDRSRECALTDYAQQRGANIMQSSKKLGCWLLRSPGYEADFVTYVDETGAINYFGDGVFPTTCALRPAIWVKQ